MASERPPTAKPWGAMPRAPRTRVATFLSTAGCSEERVPCPISATCLDLSLVRAWAGGVTESGAHGAVLHPGLDACLVAAFERFLRARLRLLECCDPATEGLESGLVHELAVKVWKWRRPVHINILETPTLLGCCVGSLAAARVLRELSACATQTSRAVLCTRGGTSPSENRCGSNCVRRMPTCPTARLG